MPRDNAVAAKSVAGSPTSAYDYRAFEDPDDRTLPEREAPVPTLLELIGAGC